MYIFLKNKEREERKKLEQWFLTLMYLRIYLGSLLKFQIPKIYSRDSDSVSVERAHNFHLNKDQCDFGLSSIQTTFLNNTKIEGC